MSLEQFCIPTCIRNCVIDVSFYNFISVIHLLIIPLACDFFLPLSKQYLTFLSANTFLKLTILALLQKLIPSTAQLRQAFATFSQPANLYADDMRFVGDQLSCACISCLITEGSGEATALCILHRHGVRLTEHTTPCVYSALLALVFFFL